MSGFYLVCLLVAIFGMYMIDRRFRLVFYDDVRRALLTLTATVGVFVLWDYLGITLGIFKLGISGYDLGVELFAEFPVEELFFLFLLSYVSLICYVLLRRRINK